MYDCFHDFDSFSFTYIEFFFIFLAGNPFFDLRNNKDMLMSGRLSKTGTFGKESAGDIQDFDIFFYDTMPSEMYLKQASYKNKKEAPKWVSHSIRSPFQKAFEIAMLKFNLGLG